MKHLIADQPNELVCMDFTVLEKADDGIENVLVITDAFTKWTRTIPTRDQTAKNSGQDFGQGMVLPVWSTKEAAFRSRQEF